MQKISLFSGNPALAPARPMRSHPAPLSSRRRRGKLRRTDLKSG